VQCSEALHALSIPDWSASPGVCIGVQVIWNGVSALMSSLHTEGTLSTRRSADYFEIASCGSGMGTVYPEVA